MKIRVLFLGFPTALAADFQKRFSCYQNIRCVTVSASDDACSLIESEIFQLILIYFDNIEPARRDGLLSRLRRISYAPIVVLTDQYTEQSICYLTSLGADLILFSNEQACILFTLATAQLRQYIRYSYHSELGNTKEIPFRVGDIFIDPLRRYAEIKGRFVELRPREFSLLLYFMRNPGAVLTNDQIFEQAWGTDYAQSVGRAVYELRQKIEPDPKNPIYIETVHRVGYRFMEFFGETCGRKESKRKEKGK